MSSSSTKRPRLRLELSPVASCSALDAFNTAGNVGSSSSSGSAKKTAISSTIGGFSRQRSEQRPPSSATVAGRRLWLCPDDDLGRQASDSADQERSQLWIDRYGPAGREELCLHKKKLDELESRLSSRPRLLLVQGPCGAGKSAAVRALCDRLALRPAYLDDELDACANGANEVMQALMRLARFRQAGVIVWDEPAVSPSYGDAQHHHQYQHNGSAVSEAAALRALLDQFLGRCCDVCLVLISCNERLLPRDWLEDNGAVIVQVNPVARTQLIRCLNSILTKRHLSPASYKSLTESIVAAADGDIRAAVSGLQFSLQFALSTTGSRRAGYIAQSASGVLFRDTPYQLFHAVGRLLHAKRGEPKPGDPAPLLEEPEAVSERCSLPVDLLLSFAHANAAVHFSQEAMSALASLSDAFSLADRLSAAWTTESDAKPHAISLASRALVYHLVGSNRAPNQFRPIRKPPKLPPAASAAAAARNGADVFYTPACLRARLTASLAGSAAVAAASSGGVRFVICPERDLQLEAAIVDDDD